MKKNRVLWQSLILVLAATFSSCGDKESTDTTPHSLYAIARQSDSAPLQYKAEMPVFSLNDIRSFNTKTGEIIFNDLTFDKHLFYDSSCQYSVYFYDEHGLLFDARAVSWLSSVGYFDQLTFQCAFYGPDDQLQTTNNRFYLQYGYPGIIEGDETVKELMKKNAAGMERFTNILRQAGKLIE